MILTANGTNPEPDPMPANPEIRDAWLAAEETYCDDYSFNYLPTAEKPYTATHDADGTVIAGVTFPAFQEALIKFDAEHHPDKQDDDEPGGM